MNAVEIKEVNKSFGSKNILHEVNLTLPSGSCVGLLGRNGAGKSTLINILANVCRSDSGSITIMGSEHSSIEAKKKIGFLLQEPTLIEEFTGRQYLQFVGALYGIKEVELSSRIESIFDYFFGSGEELDRKISNYSTGMQSKLKFCSCVLHTPKCLILDEPFLGIDVISLERILEFLKLFHTQGGTVFVSSNNLIEIQRICSRVVIIENTRIIFDDSISNFLLNGHKAMDSALLSSLNYSSVSDTIGNKLSWIFPLI